MPQVMFELWCLDPEGRRSISVAPDRVECTENFSTAFLHAATGEKFPAATRIVMKSKREYLVQGELGDVVDALNLAEET